ncbi:hypothetical protein HDZ31DRAFT_84391 [Schizophyllum fasciatum]
MATPGRPRLSAIPTPGRSAIPAPGTRSRSASTNAGPYAAHTPATDADYVSRSLADAIRANNPAQHRGPPRPSSVASTASSVSAAAAHPQRSKTPTSRPKSRSSDVFARSSSRSGTRPFEVGDTVRIASLGYEGTLQYIGEIDGKPGLWAGVELSGGFYGKGKNDGSVAGKRYFVCPPNCGVFVSTAKLSQPSSQPRPSSVASSYSGRATPSFSGRVTPSSTHAMSMSYATPTPAGRGRVTPAAGSGRVTPGTTPGPRPRLPTMPKSIARPSLATPKVTEGSRASKYASMTAQQLSSRKSDADGGLSPARDLGSPARLASPSQKSRTSSPTRPPGSPFNTPKPGLSGRGIPASPSSKGRTMTAPRPRLPSAIAMPPPASPSSSTRSVSLNDNATSDLLRNGRALQDKMAALLSTDRHTPSPSPRPDSSASAHSSLVPEEVERLQARIVALEYENERLRTASQDTEANTSRVKSLQDELTESAARIADLSGDLADAKRALSEQTSLAEKHAREHQDALRQLESQKTSSEGTISSLKAQMEEMESLVATLKDAVKEKEGVASENDATIQAKNAEIAALDARLKRTQIELEDERHELSAQIDELRQAGQETIALYEERLSAVDTERYELETKLAALEAAPRRSTSPAPAPTAAAIDNEALREQVAHLQAKMAGMEDALEDARAAAERDEVSLRDKMRRLREKEDAMRLELSAGQKEVEEVAKSEEAARRRLEEVEEAFRESTVALENARAEVEGLRAELANVDALVASGNSLAASRSGGSIAEQQKLQDEVTRLRGLLEEAKANSQAADDEGLEDMVTNLTTENTTLQETVEDLQRQVSDLRQTLEDRSAELESVKKKANRDVAINNGVQESPAKSSKAESSNAREEITGLKHIVQELQKEGAAAAQRQRALEAENQLLTSEIEQLRQEVAILEDNLDKSVNLDETPLSPSLQDVAALQKAIREQKTKFEIEMDQLRKRATDAEMKNARAVHDLNKEIGELESLIETKIYREDELEQEIERLNNKLAKQKKKMSDRPSSTASTLSTASESTQVCEICERPGHDIFTCDLLKEDSGRSSRASSTTTDLFCEDCEGHGHTAAECPHSQDIF